jgi:hypothetical protein
MIRSLLIAAAMLVAGEAWATTCETSESIKERAIANAYAQSARESMPFYGCNEGCSMASSVADSMRMTAERFLAESHAHRHIAEQLEVIQCSSNVTHDIGANSTMCIGALTGSCIACPDGLEPVTRANGSPGCARAVEEPR